MNLILFRPEEIRSYFHDGKLNVPMSDERGAHMIGVLKLQVGDTVRVGVVGEPNYGRMEVADLRDRSIALVKKGEVTPSPALNDVTIILGQVRPICMKRILRDVVALGIRRVILTTGETCEKSYANAGIYKTGEYLQYLVDGGMQAASTLLTGVEFASSVDEAIGLCSEGGVRVLLDNTMDAEPLSRMTLPAEAGVVLAIGPERGWTDAERQLFCASGFLPKSLGPRILRTETAVPVGGALVLSLMSKL